MMRPKRGLAIPAWADSPQHYTLEEVHVMTAQDHSDCNGEGKGRAGHGRRRRWMPIIRAYRPCRACRVCRVEFTPTTANNVYCSQDCSRRYYAVLESRRRQRPEFRPETRVCRFCGNEFLSPYSYQIYCGRACSKAFHAARYAASREIKPEVLITKTCPVCNVTFEHSSRAFTRRYCDACKAGKLTVPVEKAKPAAAEEKAEVAPTPIPFENLDFASEAEFHAWFNRNYHLFGFKSLVRTGCFFPDVRAECFDGRWIDVEIEYHARNFSRHRHNPGGCDLVLSFLSTKEQEHVCGVPVISLFEVTGFQGNADYDRKSRRLTPFFRELIRACNAIVICAIEDRLAEVR
jgi:hypothetical protein